MQNLLTQNGILFLVTIVSVTASVLMYFWKPREDLDKRQAVSETATEGQAKILAQQVQWEKEATEKRFAEMGQRMDAALTLAQNHTHTVDVKVDVLIGSVNEFKLTVMGELTKLSTIIDERIPKRKI